MPYLPSSYLKTYLDYAGLVSTDELVAVETIDASGILIFNRFNHSTQVLNGDFSELQESTVNSDAE